MKILLTTLIIGTLLTSCKKDVPFNDHSNDGCGTIINTTYPVFHQAVIDSFSYPIGIKVLTPPYSSMNLTIKYSDTTITKTITVPGYFNYTTQPVPSIGEKYCK